MARDVGGAGMKPSKSHLMIFVSHSHRDKEIASTIKEELERIGLSVFVAHEDISPTEEWQGTILKKLKECDVFLALLTKDFEKSHWTDQETGLAIAFNKAIIPIKIDANPYGFISKYQALRWQSDPKQNIKALVKILYGKGVVSTDALIESFAKSKSFQDAGFKSDLLRDVAKFTKKQINTIAKAAMQNDQIFNSFKAKEYLSGIFLKYQDSVASTLMDKLKQLSLVT